MPLVHQKLFSQKQYAAIRDEFRARIMEHKANRRLAIGLHATLHFEDDLTMKYQVQEMLRLERIYEPEAIQQELDVYNPLIPDGSNWKATFMIEYEDAEELSAALARLKGIEKTVWMQAEGCGKVYAIRNENPDRENEDKTSAVHYMRFELTPEMIEAVEQGAKIVAGIDHPEYREKVEIPARIRDSLASDLL